MLEVDIEYLKDVINTVFYKLDRRTWIELFENDKSGIACTSKLIEFMENDNNITSRYDDYIKLKDYLDSIIRYIQMSKICGVSLFISIIVSIIVFYEKYEQNIIVSVLSCIIHRYNFFDEKIVCIKKNIIEEIYSYDNTINIENIEKYLDYMEKCQLFEYSDKEKILNTEDTILPMILNLYTLKR